MARKPLAELDPGATRVDHRGGESRPNRRAMSVRRLDGGGAQLGHRGLGRSRLARLGCHTSVSHLIDFTNQHRRACRVGRTNSRARVKDAVTAGADQASNDDQDDSPNDRPGDEGDDAGDDEHGGDDPKQ